MPTFQLSYHPPYDWAGTLEFLRNRSIRDVEAVTPDSYIRTVSIRGRSGEIKVTHLPEKHSLEAELPAVLK
ncbi:MAG: adenosine deaminase, partial [Verrucomicrobiaceae bacterium]